MILGITGVIGAGKSLVTHFFQQLGAEVVSADQLAREVVAPGSVVLGRLVEHFGPAILLADGGLDRQVLAERIFANPAARQELNRIIHPAIAILAETRLREASQRAALVVYEAPLLFEAGAETRVDAVLTVRIDEELQLRRLMSRDGLTEAQARARIDAQMSQEEKVARADFVIDNSGPPAVTEAQVRSLYRQLVPAAIQDPAEIG